MAGNQSKEISRLKDELQTQIQRKSSVHNTTISQDNENHLANLQKQYEIESDIYKGKCQAFEEYEQETNEKLKNKGIF